jgi:hypothetical protein
MTVSFVAEFIAQYFEFSHKSLRARIWQAPGCKAATFGDEKVAVVCHKFSYRKWGNCLYFLVSMWSERQGSW